MARQMPGLWRWNTFIEERIDKSSLKEVKGAAQATPLTDIETVEGQRMDTGSAELNRVLGEGLCRELLCY